MARFEEIKIFINGRQPTETLSNLRRESKKLKREIAGLKPGTEKFIKASNKLGEVEADIGAINKQVTSLKGQGKSGLQGLTGAFKFLKAGALAAVAVIISALVKLAVEVNKTARETLKIRSALQSLGMVAGAELDAVAAQIQTIGRRFDKDFNEVMQASINLSKNFGISQKEALDIIQKGFIKGADLSGDFLEQIKEYPVFFKKAGFSAEEFVKVVSTGVKEGVFSDKFPDSIKEIGLRISEFAKPTKDALIDAFGGAFTADLEARVKSGSTNILQALQEIGKKAKSSNLTIQQTAKLTADLGGGPTEDLGGLVKQVTMVDKALQSNLEATTENEQNTLKLVKAQNKLERSNQEVAKQYKGIAQASDESRLKFKLLINQGVIRFLKFINPLVAQIRKVIKRSKILKVVMGGLNIAFKTISKVVSIVFQVLKAGFSTLMAVGGLMENIALAVYDAIKNMISFISNLKIMKPVVSGVRKVFGFLGRVLKPVVFFFKNLDAVVAGLGGSLSGLISRLGTALRALASFNFSKIRAALSNLFSGAKIGEDFDKSFDSLRNRQTVAAKKIEEDRKKAEAARKKREAARKKREAEEAKKREEAKAAEAARRAAQQRRLTQDELKAAKAANKKLLKTEEQKLSEQQALNKKFRDLAIANIANDTQRAIAERQAAAADEIGALKGTDELKAAQQKEIEKKLAKDIATIKEEARLAKNKKDKKDAEEKLELDLQRIEQDKEVKRQSLLAVDEAAREITEMTAEQTFDAEQARLEALFQLEQAALQKKLKLVAKYPKRRAKINKEIEANQTAHNTKLNTLDQQRLEFKKTIIKTIGSVVMGITDVLKAVFGENEAVQKAALAAEAAVAISKIIINGAIERAKIAAANPVASVPLIIASQIRTGVSIAQVIAAKTPKILGAKGGQLVGPSHAQGGIPGTGAFGNIEVEGGEVLLSRATAANNPELVSRLLNASVNEGGRRIMQDGGVLPTATPTTSSSTQPEQAAEASAAADAVIMQKMDEVIASNMALSQTIEANADAFKKVFVSPLDLERSAQRINEAASNNTLS